MGPIVLLRENVRIVVEDDKPMIDVQPLEKELLANNTLIRILFTLTGTKKDGMILKDLTSFNNIPEHFGYTSIGIVEEVGIDQRFVEKGNIVLIPAHYSKYLKISDRDAKKIMQVLFKTLPAEIDRVDALFVPVLCSAIELYSNLNDPNEGSIIFLGCNLLGAILLKLLNHEGIQPIIYLDEQDFKADLLLDNGAHSVIENGKNISQEMCENIKDVFIFSGLPWVENIKQSFLNDDMDFYNTTVEKASDEKYPWASYDVQKTALDLINKGKLHFKDLIAQHVHAEAVVEVQEAIKKITYKGKALVYDW